MAAKNFFNYIGVAIGDSLVFAKINEEKPIEIKLEKLWNIFKEKHNENKLDSHSKHILLKKDLYVYDTSNEYFTEVTRIVKTSDVKLWYKITVDFDTIEFTEETDNKMKTITKQKVFYFTSEQKIFTYNKGIINIRDLEPGDEIINSDISDWAQNIVVSHINLVNKINTAAYSLETVSKSFDLDILKVFN